MITKEKIKIFKRYEGDISGWVRSSSKNEKIIMTDNDWYLIDSLLQDLSIVKKGLTSLEFSKSLDDKLRNLCDNEETITLIKTL